MGTGDKVSANGRDVVCKTHGGLRACRDEGRVTGRKVSSTGEYSASCIMIALCFGGPCEMNMDERRSIKQRQGAEVGSAGCRVCASDSGGKKMQSLAYHGKSSPAVGLPRRVSGWDDVRQQALCMWLAIAWCRSR
jgi:hypothetical protein